jgi:hypothetical protein
MTSPLGESSQSLSPRHAVVWSDVEAVDWSVSKNIERSSLMGRQAQGDIKRHELKFESFSIQHSSYRMSEL